MRKETNFSIIFDFTKIIEDSRRGNILLHERIEIFYILNIILK